MNGLVKFNEKQIIIIKLEVMLNNRIDSKESNETQ